MAKRIIITCDRCGKIVYHKILTTGDKRVLQIYEEKVFYTVDDRCICPDCIVMYDPTKEDPYIKNPCEVTSRLGANLTTIKFFKECAKQNSTMQEFGDVISIRPLENHINGVMLTNYSGKQAVFDWTDWFNPQFYYVDKDNKPIDPPKKEQYELFRSNTGFEDKTISQKTNRYLKKNVHLYNDGMMIGSDNCQIWYDDWACSGNIKYWDRTGELVVIDHLNEICYYIRKANGRSPK